MSEGRAIVRNTSALAAARIIERLGHLAIAFLITRRSGVAALGTYAAAMAYYQLIATAGEMGTTNLLVREIAKDLTRTRSYLSHAGILAAGLSVVVMGLAWGVVPQLGFSPELRSAVLVVALAILPGALNTIQEAVFVAHRRVHFETLPTLAATVVTVVVSAVLLARGYGVVALLVTFVVVEYAVTVTYFLLIHRRIARLAFEFQATTARTLVRDLRPFAGSSLVGALFARPEVILLSLMASDAQVGYYSAALKVVDLWQFVPHVYMVNVFPLLARSYHLGDGRVEEVQNKAVSHLLAIGFPVSVGLAVAAEPIVETLYGGGFGLSVVVLRLLAANVALYCLHSVLWRILAARGEQGRVLRIQLVSLVVRLGMAVALIAQLGARGAAVATVGGVAIHAGLLAAGVARDGTRLDVVGTWRFAAAACLMGLTVSLLTATVGLAFVVATAAVVYVVGALVFRAVRPGDVAFLRHLVPTGRRTP